MTHITVPYDGCQVIIIRKVCPWAILGNVFGECHARFLHVQTSLACIEKKVRTVEALYRSLFFLSTQLVVLYISIIFDSVKLVLVQNMHDIFAAGC